MKRIKKFMLAIAMVMTAAFTTGCEEIVKSSYFVTTDGWSTNARANLYLQQLVNGYINDGTGMPKMFFGEQNDAITWFDTQCDHMESTAFCKDIPLINDGSESVVLTLESSADVKSRKVTFRK